MLILKIVCLAIGSYLLGNINIAVIIAKLKGVDIRKMGSGNPGTVNMIRNLGNKLGALTLIGDIIKGIIPSLIGLFLLNDSLGVYIGGFSVMIGHMFPVFFKFKGGKGVATVIGIYAVAYWWVALIVFAVAVVYVIFFHYGFVSSMIIVFTMSAVELIWGAPSGISQIARIILIVGILLFISLAHRKNFVRLFQGKEGKIYIIKSMKPKDAPAPIAGAETKDAVSTQDAHLVIVDSETKDEVSTQEKLDIAGGNNNHEKPKQSGEEQDSRISSEEHTDEKK